MTPPEATAPGRRGPLGRPVLSLLFLLAFALLMGLGTWQVQRLQWKRALLQDIAVAREAPASPLPSLLEAVERGETVDYTRVVIDCPGIDQAPYLRLYALEGRVAGFRAISVCAIKDAPYPAILVDRGFVADAEAARLTTGGPLPRHRAVVGLLRAPEPGNMFTPENRPAENAWYRRDADAMSRALDAGPVAPVFLMLESPPPEGFGPRPSALPQQLSNRHLGYAITWFGLAVALAGVYVALLFRRSPPS